MKAILLLSTLVALALADVSHLVHIPIAEEIKEEIPPPPPPKPYAFGYAAGRFPGHIDRTHSEVGDGSGVIHGSYSYIDPRHQIRTVQYVADENGFHPVLNKSPPPLPRDSPVVAAAKDKHLQQFAAIAEAHQHAQHNFVVVPNESVAVQKARAKHYDLFQKIAEQHAKIAAERAAEKAALEEKSEERSLEHY